jgi:thiamine-monophosphate kinase
MTDVLEHALIERLAAGLPRSALQLNALHESDAELLRLPGTGMVLAVTTDGLAEELATGLYRDPELIGWMLVTVNASDLAAVGAEPLGIVLCETLPPDVDPSWIVGLQAGVRAGSAATGLAVLGGDTNMSPTTNLTATALGLIRDGRPLTRCGCAPGDVLFASGSLGLGSAFALLQLKPELKHAMPLAYRPAARLCEGRLLRGYASCCMDTSDGAIATLDELMRRNAVGFRLETDVTAWTCEPAVTLARAVGLSPWVMHAGPHGEFELLFAIPAGREPAFLAHARRIGWEPLRLGRATREPGAQLVLDGHPATVDTGRVRNLFAEAHGDIERYIGLLVREVSLP